MTIRHFLQLLIGKAPYSLWKTLYVNYKVFPRATAKVLPVKVGHRVELKGLYKGCIVLPSGISPHKYMFRLGVSPWPLYSNKSMYTWVWFHKDAKLIVGDEVDINSGCRLVITANATVTLGNHFFINQNSLLYCSKSILFGDNCTLGWDCQAYDSDFHICQNKKTGETKSPFAPIRVGDNVWIANRTTIAKGSVIPSNSVIGSNSLVNNDLSSFNEGGLFAGIPATLRKEGISYITDKKEEARLRKKYLHEKGI